MNIPELNKRVKVLIDHYCGGSVNQFAKTLAGVSQQKLNRVFNIDTRTGKYPLVTTDIIVAITEMYVEISIEWLLLGKGNPFITKTTEKAVKINDGINDGLSKLPKRPSNTEEKKTKTTENLTVLNGKANSKANGKVPKLHETLPNESPKIALQSPTSEALLLIPVVDVSAAAGDGFFNQDYIDQTNIISLPRQLFKKRAGQRYCIKIAGYSMYPTLSPESYIIIRHLDCGEWGYIKDDSLYVITDTEGKTVVKRVLNDLYDTGLLRCISDNPDKTQYFDFAIPEDEISNVFEVELYLTSDLNANIAVKQMTDQAEIVGMKMSIEELQKAIIRIEAKL